MLSGLAICAAITAAVAGLAGAWWPCGFSMVETIGSAMGDTRRTATIAASVTFTLGAVVGGVLTFGGLAAIGGLLDPGSGAVREGVGAVLAVAAAIADWRGVKLAPQIRRQVPERWRRTLPLSLAGGLYGILLGLGFTTFVLAFAVWALAGISLAMGDPGLGVLVGVGFGLGRAAPVLFMAPCFGGAGRGARRLEGMASEPRMWLGLRRLDALGLALCALLLGGASAAASVLPGAYDPSVAGGEIAWQALAGPAILRLPSGARMQLPGSDPTLGGSLIAWQSPGTITVADSHSLTPVSVLAAVGVDALAMSQSWVVYRARTPGGGESLTGVSLLHPPSTRPIAKARLAGELGRPALEGSSVVFAQSSPDRSALVMVNLDTGARRILRSARAGALLANPSLLGRRLLYERLDRCAQQLRLGTPHRGRSERVLLSLPSTARRDTGYQRGYTHAYNSASRCRGRGAGKGASEQLGATALGPGMAYVTELDPARSDARILAIRR